MDATLNPLIPLIPPLQFANEPRPDTGDANASPVMDLPRSKDSARGGKTGRILFVLE